MEFKLIKSGDKKMKIKYQLLKVAITLLLAIPLPFSSSTFKI